MLGLLPQMNEHKPRVRTQIAVLATFFIVVLPAIFFAAMGYMWFVEHGLKIDAEAQPESIVDHLLVFLLVLPMIAVMVLAIFLAGIPWMFFMSRILPWADIEYFTAKKGPRVPLLSDWLDRVWQRMIECRRPESPTSGSSQ